MGAFWLTEDAAVDRGDDVVVRRIIISYFIFIDSERQDLKRKKMGRSDREAGRKEAESNRFLWDFLLTQKTFEIVRLDIIATSYAITGTH
jgi:hypothetical protein